MKEKIDKTTALIKLLEHNEAISIIGKNNQRINSIKDLKENFKNIIDLSYSINTLLDSSNIEGFDFLIMTVSDITKIEETLTELLEKLKVLQNL